MKEITLPKMKMRYPGIQAKCIIIIKSKLVIIKR